MIALYGEGIDMTDSRLPPESILGKGGSLRLPTQTGLPNPFVKDPHDIEAEAREVCPACNGSGATITGGVLESVRCDSCIDIAALARRVAAREVCRAAEKGYATRGMRMGLHVKDWLCSYAADIENGGTAEDEASVKYHCCYVNDDDEKCDFEAQWVLTDGPEPGNGTHSCTTHVGLLLDYPKETVVAPIGCEVPAEKEAANADA